MSKETVCSDSLDKSIAQESKVNAEDMYSLDSLDSLGKRDGARRFARLALNGALAALLLWSAPMGSAYAAPGAAPAAAPPSAASSGPAAQPAASAAGSAREEPHSWLLKWREPGLAKPLPGTRVLSRQAMPAAALDVVRPADPGADTAEWLRRLRQTPGVEYVQPSSAVKLLGAVQTDDPELPKQLHLNQIRAKEAWATVHDQMNMTIALVDTGVDLDHPDLKNNLVAGTNLVNPGKPPEDDNGHGTAVAGVLAGEGDNKEGVSGILWHAKIMPIKALDKDGFGDEERLGEAILYAVKNGARIVVLSVGLYRYSPYMNDIAQYAETKGVLLVAASGNDGLSLGAKAKVKYPAAYPTVLAVGGTNAKGNPEPRSNPGPEIDIAAPWNVYTTAVGGGYKHEEGTSMAAPQAAAAAALVWAQHPDYKPYEIRAMLRQTAKDIGNAGVDNASGYGLLQLDKAVSATLKADSYEPNNSRDNARKFPLYTKISAELSGGKDKDWYIIDAPYAGVILIQFQGITVSGESIPPIQMTHYTGEAAQSTKDAKLGNQTVEWNVKKGRNYFELQFFNQQLKQSLPYLLTSTFEIAPDAYEKNDKPYQAFTLAPRSQTIIGNFHQTGDRDWFAIHFETGGTLKINAEADSVRVDLAIAIQRSNEMLQDIDDNGEGESETSQIINVTAGTYYIRVYNAMSAQAIATAAQYTLQIEYKTKYTDPNEPNNKSYEATGIRPGSDYQGVIGVKGDLDWYQLRLTKKSMVRITVNGIPTGIKMKAVVTDKRQKILFTLQSAPNRTIMTLEQQLDAGLYYIKVSAETAFDKQYYGIRVDTDPMVAGFRDIAGHWTESAIVELNKRKIVGGSGDFRFNPNQSITRAEAVSMLVRAFDPQEKADLNFNDVPMNHWAYASISKAIKMGWIAGYTGGKFGPSQSITREEMSVILARVLRISTVRPASAPFRDVERTRWSAAAILGMKQKKLISGYPDLRFKPEQTASRGEFASVLLRVLNEKR
ncbi:hypothetical protein Back11_52160 [Paenibacillus baekrokdamisoli]|uniref:Uncharacterized protein n=1 Tax=Paenibacillus baekrokdamisoli TaxID=1712516 RepID=A0A3G9JD30_9BACL|nr:S8 family serine peptidase [Paenibacillus baekrokdamisoli]MBB3069053.1 subtilisin family serine protease [Paenibacillus baekrokdamisoli]BBH23871.1 hypothetical protein Back11_52160 [Paenibacillus baekrokdamisoli]